MLVRAGGLVGDMLLGFEAGMLGSLVPEGASLWRVNICERRLEMSDTLVAHKSKDHGAFAEDSFSDHI